MKLYGVIQIKHQHNNTIIKLLHKLLLPKLTQVLNKARVGSRNSFDHNHTQIKNLIHENSRNSINKTINESNKIQ